MPSSTSNSNARLPRWPWRSSWAVAVPLALALLLARESFWRAQGFFPNVQEDVDLWCLMRERASSDDPCTIALLGASRMQRGVVPGLLEERCPGYRVLQLAIAGTSPMPVLMDLARDERFRGIVVCSLSAQFLVPGPANEQARYVAYYHTEWNLARRLGRQMQTALQRRLVIAQLALSWRVVLRQLLDGERPRPPAVREYADRFAVLDFTRPDVDPSVREHTRRYAINWFSGTARAAHERTSREEWVAYLETVEEAVRRIQARGGQVVFVRCVSNGPVRVIEEHFFPRERYWDVLARTTSAVAIHFEDVPAMRGLRCPEWAHLDYPDTVRFTHALADELHRRGIVRDPAAAPPNAKAP